MNEILAMARLFSAVAKTSVGGKVVKVVFADSHCWQPLAFRHQS